jgi:undecaprenyl-diphosphatase
MQLWQSVLLGLVEGVTEFLPVSSTAHLLLTQRLLGLRGEAANAYAIAIQAGAILAVLALYRERIGAMLAGALGRDPEGLRVAQNVLAAFVPAAVLGKLFDKAIERHLLGLWPVVIAWFVGGVVILVVSRRSPRAGGRRLAELDLRGAVLIGLAQCLAMWPGTSRSLATIVAGLLLGLELTAAVEFSFLLGVVTLSAAAAYKTLKGGAAMLHDYGALNLATGFAVAALSAAASVKWMVDWLQRRGLGVFGWYRIALAAVVTGLLVAGVVAP